MPVVCGSFVPLRYTKTPQSPFISAFPLPPFPQTNYFNLLNAFSRFCGDKLKRSGCLAPLS